MGSFREDPSVVIVGRKSDCGTKDGALYLKVLVIKLKKYTLTRWVL